MSSEFLPINMNRRVSTEDTSYLRQNQYGNHSKTAKVASAGVFLPSNEDLKTGIENALQAIQQRNSYPERGSILNILV